MYAIEAKENTLETIHQICYRVYFVKSYYIYLEFLINIYFKKNSYPFFPCEIFCEKYFYLIFFMIQTNML